MLESILRRDRALVATCLAAIAVLAWAYLIRVTGNMHGMAASQPVSGMDMPGMGAPLLVTWSSADFFLMFTMWVVMMVGMMTPSVTPMVLIYARVARQAEERGHPFPVSGWFFGGYLVVWTAFALLATAAQWFLEQAALLSPAMSFSEAALGGAVLIAAGIYQWTPIKESCLTQCQAPLMFIQRHGGFRNSRQAALWLGVQHGAYCVGCCWMLMALLFAAGVMNLLWIAALMVIVLLEKILPFGRAFSRAVGVLLVGFGAWTIWAGELYFA